MHFVLVTNGWRRLDLNTSAGDSCLPRPLRYLALGERGLVLAGGCVSLSPPKVHVWSLAWEPHQIRGKRWGPG